MMTSIKRKPRSRPRVADSGSVNREAAKPVKARTTQKKSNATVKRLEQPEGALLEITYTASELVPVAQYANVSVGPIQIVRTFVDPGTDDDVVELIEAAIRETGAIVQTILAEDREIVEESVRAYNSRNKDDEKKGGRR